MELNEFIKEVITQINLCIADAKNELGKSVLPDGGLVSEGIPYVKDGIGPNAKAKLISNLLFELSLTDSKRDASKGGIGVLLGSVNFGLKGNNEAEHIALSKIKFNIPIQLH